MNTWLIFKKTIRELFRDRLILILTLSFPPFFVFLYYLFFPSGSTTYDLLVLIEDEPVHSIAAEIWHAREAVMVLEQLTYPSGDRMLEVQLVDELETALAVMADREAQALLIFPPDFSRTIEDAIEDGQSPASPLVLQGDLSNPYYMLTAVLSTEAVQEYISVVTGQEGLLQLSEIPLGDTSMARSEFEFYIPGLFVFAAIMLIFLAAMVITAEVESGTFMRIRMSRIHAWEYLLGSSLALILVGILALALAFAASLVLGFQSAGSLGLAFLVACLTCVAIIGSALLIAAWARTVSQAFVIANFPLGIYMFFSGAIYPVSQVELFKIGKQVIGLYDILPPTHAVNALNKIMVLGMGVGEIRYELIALTVLSLIFYLLGAWLFNRRHMRYQN